MDSHLKDAWVDEMRAESNLIIWVEENPQYTCDCCGKRFNEGYYIYEEYFCDECGSDEITILEFYSKLTDLNDKEELQTLINFIEQKKPLNPKYT